MPMNAWVDTSAMFTPHAATTLARTAVLATLAIQAMVEFVWMSTSVFWARIHATLMRLAATQLDPTIASATPVIPATAPCVSMLTNVLASTSVM